MAGRSSVLRGIIAVLSDGADSARRPRLWPLATGSGLRKVAPVLLDHSK